MERGMLAAEPASGLQGTLASPNALTEAWWWEGEEGAVLRVVRLEDTPTEGANEVVQRGQLARGSRPASRGQGGGGEGVLVHREVTFGTSCASEASQVCSLKHHGTEAAVVLPYLLLSPAPTPTIAAPASCLTPFCPVAPHPIPTGRPTTPSHAPPILAL
ncbi:hypothetical protein E2C01_026050 [Portunus trituberculatus]|uniref:Uncharacterized protein n=1 Tax=Portunus trituberculatus TaxID=210409 RepID=A0A5B7EJM4_PORTR|nr:hypothetical protein [Portunus trituberculatus]